MTVLKRSLIKSLFSVGNRRQPNGIYYWMFAPLAVLVSAYVISAATYVIITPWALVMIFFSGMMSLAFLTTTPCKSSKNQTPSIVDLVFAGLSIILGVYFALNAQEIVDRIVLFDDFKSLDFAFGTLVLLLTLEITRRTTGLGLTLIAITIVLYNLFGDNLTGVLKHSEISFAHFIEVSVFTTDGIFGLPLRVAATYAFMFVLFGTLLHAMGGGNFFFNFASAVSGRSKGGPAKVAVISSGLYGMISGSPTSDVVTTGSITIPIMKRLGYTGARSGAIEVAASTGGSIVPPVLGTAAFIMVDFAGVDYADIVIATIIPAILYYIGVYAQVHFSSVRLGFNGMQDVPNLLDTLKQGKMFFIPLIVIIIALLNDYTPTMTAVYGCLSILVVSLTKLKPLVLIQVLIETCYRMVPVVGACAAAGLIIGGITMTGLVDKFSHVIYGITDAHIITTLLLASIVTIILGMGMPTPSAYILSGSIMAPMLIGLGIPVLTAHLFVLYFAVMSALTPPIAVAAYAASSIADDNPFLIALLSVKFALGAFIVPFVFVFQPELLMVGSELDILWVFIRCVLAMILLSAVIETSLSITVRLLLLVVSLMLFFG